MARHTNAQLCIGYGAEDAILSKMMGHTNEGPTKTIMMSTSVRLLKELKGRILRSLEYNN